MLYFWQLAWEAVVQRNRFLTRHPMHTEIKAPVPARSVHEDGSSAHEDGCSAHEDGCGDAHRACRPCSPAEQGRRRRAHPAQQRPPAPHPCPGRTAASVAAAAAALATPGGRPLRVRPRLSSAVSSSAADSAGRSRSFTTGIGSLGGTDRGTHVCGNARRPDCSARPGLHNRRALCLLSRESTANRQLLSLLFPAGAEI